MTTGLIHRLVPVRNPRGQVAGWKCMWCPANWPALPSIHDRYGCRRDERELG